MSERFYVEGGARLEGEVEVSEDAEDRDRVVAEIDRKRRMGENLMRVAGKYGRG